MATIETYSETFNLANLIKVTVGTNGYQGGNHSHGSRTLFRLEDKAGTAWHVKIDGKLAPQQPREIEIVLGGDHEADTFISALEFAARTLRAQLGCPLFSESEKKDEDVELDS